MVNKDNQSQDYFSNVSYYLHCDMFGRLVISRYFIDVISDIGRHVGLRV